MSDVRHQRLVWPVVLLVAACGGTPVPPRPASSPSASAGSVQPSRRPIPTSPSSPSSPSSPPAALRAGERVWVAVSVATLWVSPTSPRPVDAAALARPADPRGWLRAMSTAQERALVGRVETQALYGEQLVVTTVRGSWLRVVAPGQPSSRDPRGYPGWVPARQVTALAPRGGSQVATVVALTAWLRDRAGRAVLEASIGTRLPVSSRSASTVTLAVPGGAALVVPASAVVVGAPGAAALPRTARGVVATARGFLGVPYLWGGRSGFAVDCSGLTELVLLLHGVVLPRDTGDQARAGTAVAPGDAGAGDLVLFGPRAAVTHVGLVVGAGRMVHAPRTGSPVTLAPVGTPAVVRRVV